MLSHTVRPGWSPVSLSTPDGPGKGVAHPTGSHIICWQLALGGTRPVLETKRNIVSRPIWGRQGHWSSPRSVGVTYLWFGGFYAAWMTSFECRPIPIEYWLPTHSMGPARVRDIASRPIWGRQGHWSSPRSVGVTYLWFGGNSALNRDVTGGRD